jgi:hypothetical protein
MMSAGNDIKEHVKQATANTLVLPLFCLLLFPYIKLISTSDIQKRTGYIKQ